MFDFSGTSHQRVLHSVATVDTDHYTFLSSSAVDLATLGDPYLPMAQEKLWCEHLITKGFDALIVRAAFVLGRYDNTERFDWRDGTWFWRGTDNPVRPAIEATQLCSAMLAVALTRHTGVIRAGYGEVE